MYLIIRRSVTFSFCAKCEASFFIAIAKACLLGSHFLSTFDFIPSTYIL